MDWMVSYHISKLYQGFCSPWNWQYQSYASGNYILMTISTSVCPSVQYPPFLRKLVYYNMSKIKPVWYVLRVKNMHLGPPLDHFGPHDTQLQPQGVDLKFFESKHFAN